MNRYRISRTQISVLSIIQAIGNKATPAEISRRLFREPHSVSGLINRMEKQGLVRKTNDLDRKNLVRVVLTDKGKLLYERSAVRKSIQKIMSYLSEEECQRLKSYLERLRNKALRELGVSRKRPLILPQ